MSDSAQRRLKAIGEQLAPETALPLVRKVAGSSAGPRANGLVIIITGTAPIFERIFLSHESQSALN